MKIFKPEFLKTLASYIKLKYTSGMSTAYVISSKVIQRGSKGRTIPRFLFSLASVMLPTLDDNVLDDTLLRLSFLESALFTKALIML